MSKSNEKRSNNIIVSLIPNDIEDLGEGFFELIFTNVEHPKETLKKMQRHICDSDIAVFYMSDRMMTGQINHVKAMLVSAGLEAGDLHVNVKIIGPYHDFKECLSPNYYADENGSSDLLTHINQIFPIDQVRGFYKIVVFKYIKRYQKKNGVEDLKKANTYLQRLIKLEENKN